ncbi:MAG: stage IV sporulation protein A [Clostridiales bacterium]|nr:stage IV sporulation protein A [Clostridiales bacterium]
MENLEIYEDIANRTDGDIYVGVVGPVRTGKSTFIKNFMDLLVLPNIENTYKKERARDELPQSAAGRTIMTTEPKFVPNEAIEITVGENLKLKTRLVDCVGYLINNALGHMEGEVPRMVRTPWSDTEIPFEEAAEIGTKRVITEHSTIGILVTTDGSITEIPRADYIEAEERVVKELKQMNKPFVIVLNTAQPYSDDTKRLALDLENQYGVSVIPTDCTNLNIEDVNDIFGKILYEFPVERINLNFPGWVDGLNDNHNLKQELYGKVIDSFKDTLAIKHIDSGLKRLTSSEIINSTIIDEINLGNGAVTVRIALKDDLFYNVLTEITGVEISNEADLFSTIANLSRAKKEYDKIEMALQEVKQKGYGIVTPSMEELILDEPEMVKQGSRFGVKLRAKAPSIHLIKAEIETEVSPIVGSEKQSEELVNYLLSEFENDPIKIWESNIFGKNLHELVNEGLQNKLAKMPEDAQGKLQETLERIINEGSGGLICIIL